MSNQDEEHGRASRTHSDLSKVEHSTNENTSKNDFDFKVPPAPPLRFSMKVKSPRSLQPSSSLSSGKHSSVGSRQVLEESKSASPQGGFLKSVQRNMQCRRQW